MLLFGELRVLLENSMYTIGRKKLTNLNEYEIDAANGIFQRTSDQDTKKLTLLTCLITTYSSFFLEALLDKLDRR